MYRIHLSPGVVKTLGEQGLVVFDAQERNEQKTCENEKNTCDPKDLQRSRWGRMGTHGDRSGSKTEIVTDALDLGYTVLASELLSYGLVQPLLGQESKDSSNGAVVSMKPLA